MVSEGDGIIGQSYHGNWLVIGDQLHRHQKIDSGSKFRRFTRDVDFTSKHVHWPTVRPTLVKYGFVIEGIDVIADETIKVNGLSGYAHMFEGCNEIEKLRVYESGDDLSRRTLMLGVFIECFASINSDFHVSSALGMEHYFQFIKPKARNMYT